MMVGVTTVAVLLASLANAVLLGFVSRRLLGVPVGWPRTILVSLVVGQLGASGINALSRVIGLHPGPGDQVGFAQGLVVLLATCWMVALGLAALVVLEAIVPTGSLPNPVTWLRQWPSRRRRARRYVQVVGIATRHGLGGFLRGRSRLSPTESTSSVARALRAALVDGGVTFVKLGQMLATRPDVVGTEVARELATLQTQVPAAPWAEVEAALAAELGRPVTEVFASVEPTPLAAASVAQVHAATLLDGAPVVLKIQRPRARAQVEADVDIVLRLARWLQRTTSWGRSLGVVGLADGFAASLREELDYRVELANTRAVEGSLRAAGSSIRVPSVYAAWSGSRLLVMERLEGQPLARAGDELAALSDERRHELADELLATVLRQVLVDGVFHADLHQGNVLLTPAGTLALLDFGAVGRLDSGTSRALGVFVHAIDRNDSVAAADALLDVLDRPAELDDRRFERELGTLVARLRTGFGSSGSAGVFGELFSLVLAHGFSVPPQVAAAFRALGALEGTLATLSPELDLVTAARSHGRVLMGEQLHPGSIRTTLEDQLLTLAPVLQRLPRRLSAIGDQLEDGRLSVRVRLLAHPDDCTFVEESLRQLTVTLIATACAVCGVLLVVADSGPMMLPQLRLFTFLGATLFFFAFVLAARALARVFRPQR